MNNSQNIKPTKNDEAWEKIFEKYKILEHLKNEGYFTISSQKIIELLSLLQEKQSLSKEEISSYYGFATRQADYYSNAAKYLGLIIENEFSSSTLLKLTEEGASIFSRSYKEKILFLIEKILEHRIFYEVFNVSLISAQIPTKEEIIEIMKEHLNLENLSDKTIKRRSTTVKKWIEWIWSQIN